ncbi:JAB domain-containing protein [Liquorilactobacillus hordei]|uniref:JAB domain-containing protein n=1 Tax=Liquorilactobacillus hordei TaxID=468911 RepID=UPI001CBC4C76|nr:JAB domain-containing protein [Liquorilactobacillus hordei]MBZ2406679.1 DNA repair protein RadC [Liquorilactobacillus hordei]
MKKVVEIVKVQQVIRDCKIFTKQVNGSNDIGKALIKEIGSDTQEHFILLCLNVRNEITSYSVVHTGTVSQSEISLRDIFQRAILSNSSRLIIAHNHPSSYDHDIQPSKADMITTKKIKSASDLLGFTLLDHIIVSANSYLSFRENNLL